MSVEIDWDTLTGGSDGQHLAEAIRQFIHERFQQIELPKLIRSVAVHAFDFGSVAPEIVLKDVCQPLPDFYETATDDEGDDVVPHDLVPVTTSNLKAHSQSRHPYPRSSRDNSHRPWELELLDQIGSPTLTQGTLHGSAGNFGYFNLPGLPGTATPLAAVAGAHFPAAISVAGASSPRKPSLDPITPASSSASPASRPVSRDQVHHDAAPPRPSSILAESLDARPPPPAVPQIDPSPDDLQIVFHVTYAGDVRMSMTAEVFLDYPMPSFVGIPLKLNITGLTFNGVGILAYIRKRAHLCFLSPEDAEALVGSESAALLSPHEHGGISSRVGALLEEIKIESEMGESGEGKQVLKNVGKIEKFILEQVQRIFEEEFVYPSFWTFLV